MKLFKKGNRIRIGRLKGSKPLLLKTRQTVYLSKENIKSSGRTIHFDYRGSLKPLKKGFLIYIDDGNICLKIKKILKTKVETEVIAGGFLKERKGVNIPEARLDFPLLNEDDIKDLKFAVKHKPDYIVTAGEAEGVCRLTREYCERKGNIEILLFILHF